MKYQPEFWDNDGQPTIRIHAAAEQAKADAIERVRENNSEFVEAAYLTLLEVAAKKGELTALDVWAAYHGIMPKHPRAMGPVFIQAHRNGIIQPTNRWVKSGRTTDHNQQLRVWKSNHLP